MTWYEIVLIVLGGMVLLLSAAGLIAYCVISARGPKLNRLFEMSKNSYWAAYIPSITEQARKMASARHERVSIEGADHIHLAASFYPNKQSNHVMILYHGYYSAPSWDFSVIFPTYYERGYSILIPDVRAHGASGGKRVGFGALDRFDLLRWIDWTVSKCGDDCLIGLHGVSMGAATVLLATGMQPPKQVACAVSDCAYTRIGEVIRAQLRERKLPLKLTCRIASVWSKLFTGYSFDEVSVEESVKNSSVPTLFIHGEQDRFVPFSMLDRLYSACASEKERITFADTVHGESSHKNPQAYRTAVLSFVAAHFGKI